MSDITGIWNILCCQPCLLDVTGELGEGHAKATAQSHDDGHLPALNRTFLGEHKLINIWALVVRHGRAITFQLAEVAVTFPMVSAILADIRRLLQPPLCARRQTRLKLNESGKTGHSAALKNLASMRG